MVFKVAMGIAAAIVGMTTHQALAGGTVVPVSDDASTNELSPGGMLGWVTTRGGLLAGLDTVGSSYAFYLKFHLPDVPFDRATLRGFYSDDYGGPPTFVGAYFVPDDSWSEETISFNTQPASSYEIGGFSAGRPTEQFFEIDLTDAARSEVAGDGVLSLRFQTIDGRFGDLKYFASKEYDADKAFTLSLETAAVPLPPMVLPGLAGMAALWIGRRRLRRLVQ
jgi:hypothetical protein